MTTIDRDLAQAAAFAHPSSRHLKQIPVPPEGFVPAALEAQALGRRMLKRYHAHDIAAAFALAALTFTHKRGDSNVVNR